MIILAGGLLALGAALLWFGSMVMWQAGLDRVNAREASVASVLLLIPGLVTLAGGVALAVMG